jgi:hypothetical protein
LEVAEKKLQEEGSSLFADQPVSNTNPLKLLAPDGKMRLTDVADIEQIFRIIQSIPSKKAEPFKMWLARVGRERIDETIDPELSIDRAVLNYRRLGYSENWIEIISLRCFPPAHSRASPCLRATTGLRSMIMTHRGQNSFRPSKT